MSCPWDSLTQSSLAFCEASVCGWVKQPGNTWTNVGFFCVAFWSWARAGKTGLKSLRWFSIVALATGLGSAFFHASGTYWGGIADYGGMFLVTAVLTAINLRRWSRISVLQMRIVLGSTWSILLGLLLALPGSARAIFFIAMPCCVLELGLFLRDRGRIEYRNYFWSFAFVLIGTALWWLDSSGLVCNPKNHFISLHGLWHLCMATALYFSYRYYEQFSEVRTPS